MNNLLRKELVEQFPNLQNQSHWEAITAEVADAYKVGPKIELLNPLNSHIKNKVLRLPIIDIATYFPLFVRVQKMFESKDTNQFKFFYNNNGSLANLSLSRSDIVKALESLVDFELVSEDGSHIGYAFEQLATLASPQRLIEQEQNKTFSIKIDGKQYNFPAEQFIKFITLPDIAFTHTLYKFNPTEYGCTLPEYIYALKSYVTQSNIFTKAYFSDSQISRFQDIYQNRLIDCEAINQYTENANPLLDKTIIHPKLEKEILGKMPRNYNDLQKAQYIYLKLCQTLTYNPEFFAINQKGPRVKPHQNINFVAGITPENCEAVCYEFSVLFGKFLQQATNIKHELVFQTSNFKGGRYGNDHTLINFRCDKFLVSADAIKGILNSDLTNQKLARPILGLTCTNTNKKTVQEFKDSLREVAEDLKFERLAESKQTTSTNFESALQQFKDITADESVSIDPHVKMNFILQQITDSQLRGMDAFAYLLQLRKIIFTKDEQTNTFKVNIVREEPENLDDPIKATGIITLTTDKDGIEETSYLLFRPTQGNMSNLDNEGQDTDSSCVVTPTAHVEEITRDELISRFENHQLSYISSTDEAVHGINIPVSREFMINEYIPDP